MSNNMVNVYDSRRFFVRLADSLLMCYPTPGPRCSDHAEREYVEAEKLFSRSIDPTEKILLGVRLREKQEIFETTPRGQNDLRRAADAATGLAREELLLRMEKGRLTREQQLKDYHYAVKNKDTSYMDYMAEKGYHSGKYLDAVGITGLFLGSQYPDTHFLVDDFHTLVSDELKVFVVPEKHQQKWGTCVFKETVGFTTDDVLLEKVFRGSFDVSNPSPDNQIIIMAWFKNVLKSKGYTHVASVNRVTQNVLVFPTDELEKMYTVKLKMRRRLGGSTNFVGGIEDVKFLLAGTVFEDGEVLQPKGTRKTVVYGVLPQAKEDCNLNEELYLSWRDAFEGEDGYFEVRRRHLSNNFNITVCLQVRKPVKVTGIAKPGTVTVEEEAITVELEPEIISEAIPEVVNSDSGVLSDTVEEPADIESSTGFPSEDSLPEEVEIVKPQIAPPTPIIAPVSPPEPVKPKPFTLGGIRLNKPSEGS